MGTSLYEEKEEEEEEVSWEYDEYITNGCSNRVHDTEGDVSGIMSRPVGESEEIRRAQEKWYVLVIFLFI